MFANIAKTAPRAELNMNVGASRPPDVPAPSETISASHLKIITSINSFNGRLPFRMSPMVSYPTPNTRGTKKPITPKPHMPIAGHHTSLIVSFSKRSRPSKPSRAA